MAVKSKKITGAARGQDCTLNIVGACNYDPATTVLCHFPDESHGMGRKSCDISSGFGCHNCHQIIDGRAPWPEGEQQHEQWYMRRSQTRTIRFLIQAGILKL